MANKVLENLKYTKEHEWAKLEGNIITVGITDFAQSALGDIVFVELVEKGSNLEKGATFGTIESVKAVEEVYLPFSGEVISVNESVIDNPEILQNDPIGDGWLLIIQPKSIVLLDELMNSDEYKSKVVPN